MKNIPWLPKEILEADPTIIKYLKYTGMIRNVEFSDIIQELQSRPLTLDECIACLNWWTTESRRDLPSLGDRDNYASIRKQFLDAIVIAIDTKQTEGGKIIPLNSIKYFFNPKSPSAGSIPIDGPLPDSLLPIAISRSLNLKKFQLTSPGLNSTYDHWLDHICNSDRNTIPRSTISVFHPHGPRKSSESYPGLGITFLRNRKPASRTYFMTKPVSQQATE
jgi:hypothetical protein